MKKIKEYIKKNDILFIIFLNIKAYAIYILNKISNYQLEKNKFYQKHSYPLNLKNPDTYNEKIFWKKIYDRNPLIPITADKYQARSYVREVLGDERAKQILIPLLYVTDKPDTIPFNSLPVPYIIKPNHASRLFLIVKKDGSNQEEIIKTCKRWLKIPFGLWNMEWAYQSIPKKIVIEQLLLDENHHIPKDYKFHTFHGECKLIAVISDRMHEPVGRFFDREWNELKISQKNKNVNEKMDQPVHYKMMLEYAEKLANPFDYVRVDLYNLNGQIYFGELTHYPASGFKRLKNVDLNQYWNIQSKYWKKVKNKLKN